MAEFRPHGESLYPFVLAGINNCACVLSLRAYNIYVSVCATAARCCAGSQQRDTVVVLSRVFFFGAHLWLVRFARARTSCVCVMCAFIYIGAVLITRVSFYNVPMIYEYILFQRSMRLCLEDERLSYRMDDNLIIKRYLICTLMSV